MTAVAKPRIILRAPTPDDVGDILRIVRAHGLPAAWKWPEGRHGIVADAGGVVAFCILRETIYGLVVDELWEEPSREGIVGLGMLGREIECIAQRLADERGGPVQCGGIVRCDRERHIAALRKRGFGDEAVVLSKTFLPAGGRGIDGAHPP